MATMTSDVMVFRPPSPQLGDFNKVFSTYLQTCSQTEPKIEVQELLPITLPDLDKLWGLEKQGDNQSKSNEELVTPKRGRLTKVTQDLLGARLARATQNLMSGAVNLPPVTPGDVLASASTKLPGSDATSKSSSIFDSACHYVSASASTTPLSTPNAVSCSLLAVPRLDTRDVFVSSPSPTKSSGHASFGLFGTTNKAAFTQNVAAVTESDFKSDWQVSSTYKPALNMLSSDGTFRYKVWGPQPVPADGVKMWAVDFMKPGIADCIKPHYMSTKEDKVKVLYSRLKHVSAMDKVMATKVPTASNKVHIFVDLSNITIGFYDALKINHKIPVTKRMKAPRFCFEHLAHILERGRDVEKRVVAGSLLSTYARKWPDYMQEANDLGYEMNILQRVPKAASPAKKHRTIRRPTGESEWTTSDGDSAAEDVLPAQLRQGEQGVDEVLHLKMLQSALDSEPGTAVLATGDAAEAEYSDGFKKNVERLLQQGWNVEILGWSKGISSAWKDAEFTKKWGGRVRVIELDRYVEELFGAWFGAPGY